MTSFLLGLHTPCFTQAGPVIIGADDARGSSVQRGAEGTVYCDTEGCSITSIVQSKPTS